MTKFERNDSSFIKKKAKEVTKNPKIGEVVEVYEHTSNSKSDVSNFEADVSFRGEGNTLRGVPIANDGDGDLTIPTVGDRVIVQFMEDANFRPIISDTVYTQSRRAPLGLAGIEKEVYDSVDNSPAGSGDIAFTRYTEYTKNPAKRDIVEDDLDPVRTWVQVCKQADSAGPPKESDTDMKIEMFDSSNEASITLEGNQIDGDSNKGVSISMNMKTGDIRVEAENGTGTFGLSIDAKTGEFTIIDESGYGIESDGSGNFTWHYETIDYSKGTTTNL